MELISVLIGCYYKSHLQEPVCAGDVSGITDSAADTARLFNLRERVCDAPKTDPDGD